MQFRPCIDLHDGLVKQIVGSSLKDDDPGAVKTNFVAERSPAWFAELYKADQLLGGHIIKLGPGNDDAAREALAAYPGGMQIGGGITAENAGEWLDSGASHVIVTSYVFSGGKIDMDRLKRLVGVVGKNRLVLDLSCRKRGDDYFIVTDRWQNFTEERISQKSLEKLSKFCDEFLVHGADVEGKCGGIETPLVQRLAEWSPIATTYAGGVRDLQDLALMKSAGKDRMGVTIGSSLDIFGGNGITYQEAVDFCKQV